MKRPEQYFSSLEVNTEMWKVCQIRGHEADRHGGAAMGNDLPHYVCRWCKTEYTIETVIKELNAPDLEPAAAQKEVE